MLMEFESVLNSGVKLLLSRQCDFVSAFSVRFNKKLKLRQHCSHLGLKLKYTHTF